MRILIDTHILLWWVGEPELLNQKARTLLEDDANEVLVSSISVFEIVIKSRLGKLDLPEPAEEWVRRILDEQSLVPLAVRHDHALRVATLPLIHTDPFDRLLIAQSIIEDLPLMTADPIFRSYELPLIWSARRRRKS